MARAGPVAALLAALAATPLAAAGDDAPIAAIDWLSDTVAAPIVFSPLLTEPGITNSALPLPIDVMPLDRVDPASAGLISVQEAGLPSGLWLGADGAAAARAFPPDPQALLPAARDLLVLLATARADPPATDSMAFLLARVDMLLKLGDLPRARSLMEATGLHEPQIFRRWFDAELLSNAGNHACAQLRAIPEILPTYSARIFCLARGGDWNAAALTLDTAETLGVVTTSEGDLLARFLDPELTDAAPDLARPDRPTPLELVMFEAIGQSIPTATLPLAFANADLRPISGWKQRLAAAERLARSGGLSPAGLFAIYGERRPAASGGVWDRVAAIHALDNALAEGPTGQLGNRIDAAWAEMRAAGLAQPFAESYASRLLALPPGRAPGPLVAEIALLSSRYDSALGGLDSSDRARALAAVARGLPPQRSAGALTDALAKGFSAAAPGDTAPPGLQILTAIAQLQSGQGGDRLALSAGLARLRALGLHDHARRAALQVMLLDNGA